jgi:hypothetical protein
VIANHRVVLTIPAGRRRYLDVLIPQILREEGWDELQVWVNTADADDLAHLNGLPRLDPRIRLIPLPDGIAPRGPWTIHHFFTNCIANDTVYIRLDDDICYIEPQTIAKLARFRIANPEAFLIFPVIVNNAIISHIWQALGVITVNGYIGANCMDAIGWENAQFAENMHRMFLDVLRGNQLSRLKFPNRPIAMSRMSINCISWLGAEFAKFEGRLGSNNEEEWLSVTRPTQLGGYNLIYGDAVVSHFAFYPQRSHMDATDLLERYRAITAGSNECPRPGQNLQDSR